MRWCDLIEEEEKEKEKNLILKLKLKCEIEITSNNPYFPLSYCSRTMCELGDFIAKPSR